MSIIKAFLQEGILIEPSLLEFFKTNQISYNLIDVIKSLNISFLSKDVLFQNNEKIKFFLESIKHGKNDEEKALIEKTIECLSIFKKEIKNETKENKIKFKILESWKIPSRKINVDDFVKYFKNRLVILKTALQERAELVNLTAINKISNQKQNNISIIGIVYEKIITKNKNIILEIEDFTGRISVLVNFNKEDVYKKAEKVLLDDVIGIKGSGNSELLFANDIFFPDAFIPKKEGDKEDFAAFISDIHIGSSMFLEDEFLRFINWLNLEKGSDEQKEIAKKVKYLFIVGDTVDGVGVYPGQEDLLKIKDVKEQYMKLAEFLNNIRKDITIFMIPGQHDAVRIAEPQPPIDEDYAPELYKINNLVLLSNPSMVEVCGRKILLYHGASFHNIIDGIEELRLANAHNNPSKVIKTILNKRHLAPTHASTVYIPTKDTDPLAIREVPDVIATGELHKVDIGFYNNIRIIASSCWQSQTPFEEKVGNLSEPCKVPILNLKNNSVKIMDFS
ncbi:MAG: metallophosphoesterase [Candidatus Pacearchaeota archaeon]